MESFKGLPGRLEFIKRSQRSEILQRHYRYHAGSGDGCSGFAEKNKGKIILIGGGADKNLEYNECAKEVKKYIKALILFKGAATDKIISVLGKTKFPVEIVDSMKKAMEIARANSKKAILFCFSPGAPASGFSKRI